MAEEVYEKSKNVGEMNKRREKMADEKRYIIYYTFGESIDLNGEKTQSGARENV